MAMIARKMTKEDIDYLNQLADKGEKIKHFREQYNLNKRDIAVDDEKKMYYIYENGDGNKERGFPMYFSFVYNDKVGKIGYFIEEVWENINDEFIDIDCDVREYEYKAENEEEEREVQELIREAMKIEMIQSYDAKDGRCNFYNFVEGRWGK